MTDPESGRLESVASEMVGGALAVTVALPFGGDPMTAQYVTALVQPMAEAGVGGLFSAARALAARLADRNSAAIAATAAAEVGLDPADLVDRLSETPETVALLAQALRGGQATNDAGKLLALGRALASVAEDRARIDEEDLFLQHVSRIESAHMRFLRALERTPDEVERLLELNSGVFGNRQIDGISRRTLTAKDPGLYNACFALARDLIAEGFVFRIDPKRSILIDPAEGDDAVHADLDIDGVPLIWALSPDGHLLLKRARAATDE